MGMRIIAVVNIFALMGTGVFLAQHCLRSLEARNCFTILQGVEQILRISQQITSPVMKQFILLCIIDERFTSSILSVQC